MAKARVDQLLVERGLAPTRSRAQAMLLAGSVFAGEVRIDKAGTLLDAETPLQVRGEPHPYVSRGGVKLDAALAAFGVDPRGRRCLDVGASTGGFTDCLLQRGAAIVVAVDVGYGQLAHRLRIDPRVVLRERTNARALTPEDIGGTADIVVVDASFISLALLLPAVVRCTSPRGDVVALIKPQFEVGREQASRTRGVVRDPALRLAAIESVVRDVAGAGFEIRGTVDSPIEGPKGNLEAFVHARKGAETC